MAKSKNTTKRGDTAKGLRAVGGAAAGAAAGSLLGPLGAAVGAVIGGLAGVAGKDGKGLTNPKSPSRGSTKTAKRPAAKKATKPARTKKAPAKKKG